MFNNILVVCVGNICRSPVAEALLSASAPAEVAIASAGISALVGKPADPNVVRLMQERGFDITGHRARQLTETMVHASDLVLVMEKGHKDHIHSLVPSARGRVHCLGKWSDRDVPDPYRKSFEYFEHVVGLIEQDVDAWSQKLWR